MWTGKPWTHPAVKQIFSVNQPSREHSTHKTATMIVKSSESNSHYLLIQGLLVVSMLVEFSNGGNGNVAARPASSIILNPFFSVFHPKGFLIIPKKVEQNQTKIFDRDKASAVNFTVPNSISDSNKNLNSLKSPKNSTISSSGLGVGLSIANATSNHSSNQLSTSDAAELTTFFSTTNFTNITSQVGSIVEIPCTVHHLGAEETVSVDRRCSGLDKLRGKGDSW